MLTPSQLAELALSLRENREIPLKFAYTGEGAELWNEIDGEGSIEEMILLKHREAMLRPYEGASLTLLDIGSGDGEAIWPLTDHLYNVAEHVDYAALDLSTELLSITSQVFRKRYPKATITTRQIDFDSDDFSGALQDLHIPDQTSMFTLLGSTICNQPDPSRVLEGIRRGMRPGDRLMIGAEIVNRGSSNKVHTFYTDDSALDMEFSTAEAIGLRRSQGYFMVNFNRELSQIETKFKLTEAVKLSLGDEEIHLEKGAELLLMKAIEFSKPRLLKLIKGAGLLTEECHVQDGYSVTVCTI